MKQNKQTLRRDDQQMSKGWYNRSDNSVWQQGDIVNPATTSQRDLWWFEPGHRGVQQGLMTTWRSVRVGHVARTRPPYEDYSCWNAITPVSVPMSACKNPDIMKRRKMACTLVFVTLLAVLQGQCVAIRVKSLYFILDNLYFIPFLPSR